MNNTLYNSGNSINNMTCNACNGVIMDKLMAKTSPDNKIWHSNCLKCSECNMLLDAKYFETSGRLYCRNDYLTYFGPSCFGCGRKITDEQYFFSTKQTISTPGVDSVNNNNNNNNESVNNSQNTQTNTLFFHDKCFSCNYCSRPLQKGDKYCIIDNTPSVSQQTKTLMICHDICALKYYSANSNSGLQANAAGIAGSQPTLQANPPAPRAKRGRMKQKPT